MAKRQRTRTRGASNAPVGVGRLSTSLTNDPRGRRNAQVAQAPEMNLGDSLKVDRSGRHVVTPVRRVPPLDTSSSSANADPEVVSVRLAVVEAKLNELLKALTDGKFMEGGR